MRLIDADELVKQGYELVVDGLQYGTCNKSIDIDDIPTAYDIDKVNEELKKESEFLKQCNYDYEGEFVPLNNAIEIVKQGCVDADVCEWKDAELYGYYTSCTEFKSRIACKDTYWKYCPYCGKKIKVVE